MQTDACLGSYAQKFSSSYTCSYSQQALAGYRGDSMERIWAHTGTDARTGTMYALSQLGSPK